MGALHGSLHGGANEKVLDMIEEIGAKDQAVAEKRKIMGMGHREYKVKDPRSNLLEGYLRELSEKKGDWRSYEILKEIETQFRARMEEKGKTPLPQRGLLLRGRLRAPGDPEDPLHADLRDGPGVGLAGPHPGAAERQPDLQAREPVPRALGEGVRASRRMRGLRTGRPLRTSAS